MNANNGVEENIAGAGYILGGLEPIMLQDAPYGYGYEIPEMGILIPPREGEMDNRNYSNEYLVEVHNIINQKIRNARINEETDFFILNMVFNSYENVIEVMVLETATEDQIAQLKNLDPSGDLIRVVRSTAGERINRNLDTNLIVL